MNKEELIKKIKALADKGVGGEKANAQKLLKELMLKYNIQEEDIEEEALKDFEFSLPKFFNSFKLAVQVLYSVIGDIDENKGFYFIYTRSGRRKYRLRCTTAEFLEFEAKYKFYSYHFKIEADRFYSAFLQANVIFPPNSKIKERKNEPELTEEDLKMLQLARNLEKHDYRLQIEGGRQ